MVGLEEEIEEYVSARKVRLEQERRFTAVCSGLFEKINELFKSEVGNIEAKLPKGYSVRNYSVGPGAEPNSPPLVLMQLNGPGFEPLSVEEVEICLKYNELLRDEFERVRKKHGFSISFSPTPAYMK